jgi:hypothetical protein
VVRRYSRKTDFTARLIEPASGRNTDGINSSYAIGAVFEDLQKKGLIGGGSNS